MNCPNCNCPNKPGAQYCQMCYEVFNKSAADRYNHALKRARMRENDELHQPPTTEIPSRPAGPSPVGKWLSEIDWDGMLSKVAEILESIFHTHLKKFFFGLGVLVLAVAVVFFTSSRQKLQMFGTRLQYSFSGRNPAKYLFGFHTEFNSWSERGGRLDTPLVNSNHDEMGNVVVKLETGPNHTQKVIFQPKEWIVNQTGGLSQPVALSHPSVKPIAILLNSHGQIVSRINGNTTRMGRCLSFVAPNWPTGVQRPGAHWDEPSEWIQSEGDWQILWKGTFHWKVVGVQRWDTTSCLNMTYTADVKPKLLATPDWTKGAIGPLEYTGKASGDACFDRKGQQIHANNFIQEGVLSMPINDVYRIPPELRVGRTPRRRWNEPITAERGVLRLEIKSRLGIHKS